MKQKLKQIWYDARHQPMLAMVTLVATTLSVFLIIVVIMTQQVKIVPFSPESCRDRLLVGEYMHVNGMGPESNTDMSSALSYHAATTLYNDLDGIEHVSITTSNSADINGTTGENITCNMKLVDSEFFNIFDFELIDGHFFTPEEASAGLSVVIITESKAREMFGTTDCVGSMLSINHDRFRVVGVVKDVSTLASTAYADIYTTLNKDTIKDYNGSLGVFGSLSVCLLMKEGVDQQYVRDQVKARYAILDTELAEKNFKTVYHGAPFDQKTIASGITGSNITPDPDADRNLRLILYTILLVVPAINLSAMLHSRLRRRISYIGVRRAYGCTRSRIILDIMLENFMVTLIGGLIGVILGIIFAYSYSGLYENMDNYGSNMTPAISAVLNWNTIAIAIGICFILNLISALVPAWQASRVSPVDAIRSK